MMDGSLQSSVITAFGPSDPCLFGSLNPIRSSYDCILDPKLPSSDEFNLSNEQLTSFGEFSGLQGVLPATAAATISCYAQSTLTSDGGLSVSDTSRQPVGLDGYGPDLKPCHSNNLLFLYGSPHPDHTYDAGSPSVTTSRGITATELQLPRLVESLHGSNIEVHNAYTSEASSASTSLYNSSSSLDRKSTTTSDTLLFDTKTLLPTALEQGGTLAERTATDSGTNVVPAALSYMPVVTDTFSSSSHHQHSHLLPGSSSSQGTVVPSAGGYALDSGKGKGQCNGKRGKRSTRFQTSDGSDIASPSDFDSKSDIVAYVEQKLEGMEESFTFKSATYQMHLKRFLPRPDDKHRKYIERIESFPRIPTSAAEQRELINLRQVKRGMSPDSRLGDGDGLTIKERLDEMLTSLVNKIMFLLVVKFDTWYIHAPAREQIREQLLEFIWPSLPDLHAFFREHFTSFIDMRIRHFRDSVARYFRDRPRPDTTKAVLNSGSNGPNNSSSATSRLGKSGGHLRVDEPMASIDYLDHEETSQPTHDYDGTFGNTTPTGISQGYQSRGYIGDHDSPLCPAAAYGPIETTAGIGGGPSSVTSTCFPSPKPSTLMTGFCQASSYVVSPISSSAPVSFPDLVTARHHEPRRSEDLDNREMKRQQKLSPQEQQQQPSLYRTLPEESLASSSSSSLPSTRPKQQSHASSSVTMATPTVTSPASTPTLGSMNSTPLASYSPHGSRYGGDVLRDGVVLAEQRNSAVPPSTPEPSLPSDRHSCVRQGHTSVLLSKLSAERSSLLGNHASVGTLLPLTEAAAASNTRPPRITESRSSPSPSTVVAAALLSTPPPPFLSPADKLYCPMYFSM